MLKLRSSLATSFTAELLALRSSILSARGRISQRSDPWVLLDVGSRTYHQDPYFQVPTGASPPITRRARADPQLYSIANEQTTIKSHASPLREVVIRPAGI
jgi:hypothetical protein